MKTSLVLLLSTCLSLCLREGQPLRCVSGFIDREELRMPPDQVTLLPRGQQRIIPNINFTCDGNITKWTILGKTVGMGTGTTGMSMSRSVPELQIWRNLGAGKYTKVALSDPTDRELQCQGCRDVYEFIQAPPLAVKAGDCIGIFQPRMAQMGVQLIVEESGPQNYFVGTDEANMTFNILEVGVRSQNGLPLVAVEFTAASVADSVTISPTASISTSVGLVGSEHTTIIRMTSGSSVSPTKVHFPGKNHPSSSSSEGLIAVIISLAALVLIMTVVVIVTVTVLVIYSRHRKYSLQQPQRSIGNPLYCAEDFQDNKEMATSPVANEGVNEIPWEAATPYEVPCLSPVASSEPFYAELTPTMPSYNFEPGGPEWEIYVPTVAQRKRCTSSYAALKPDEEQSYFQESDIYWTPASNEADLYEQLSRCKFREIPWQQIKIVEHLGSGNFGVVNKGTWQSLSVGRTVAVAVKTLQPRPNCGADRVKFLQEAAIMGQFHHPNVVRLYGVVTLQESVTIMGFNILHAPRYKSSDESAVIVEQRLKSYHRNFRAMIVLELMANGDLRKYLIKMRPIPGEMVPSNMPQLCLDFCHQIASGMEYLSSKAFLHRDLAARNILVSGERICKIADFGMARDLQEEDYYVSRGGQIPVKWTAIEALTFKKYSTNSDVWSYGAVMYEIWSLGHKPFEGYTNVEVFPLLSQGYRLPPPPGCPKALYELMIQCWHPEASSRPTFSKLVQSLSQFETHHEWSESDMAVHPHAAVLGASLEVGKDLFLQLQQSYKT